MKIHSAVVFTTALLLIAIAYLWQHGASVTTIHLAGDSTVAIQPTLKRPLTGWGEPLESMLCDDVKVVNHAKNGRSTKSFIDEGLWARLLKNINVGDIVLIQFGHNDQKAENPTLHTSPQAGYKHNVQRFVADVRSRGANPVLITSMIRRAFNPQGELEQTLGEYPAVIRAVANQMGVALIDLNATTHRLIESMGPTQSKHYFLHLSANHHANYPDGIQDNTHLSAFGATEFAKLVARDLDEIYPNVVCF